MFEVEKKDGLPIQKLQSLLLRISATTVVKGTSAYFVIAITSISLYVCVLWVHIVVNVTIKADRICMLRYLFYVFQ